MGDMLSAEKRRQAFRRFMAEHNLKVRPWCKKAGVKPNNVYNFLNGHSSSLSIEVLAKLAKSAGAAIDDLEGLSPFSSTRLIPVVGVVEAGVFKESMGYDGTEQPPVSVPWGSAATKNTYALKVQGTSMNREYPAGSVLIVTPVEELDIGPHEGDHVIVERRAPDGLVETTVKELTIDRSAGIAWLWPRSMDPLHQQPTQVPLKMYGLDALPVDTAEISIKAVVIGSYMPRRR